MGTLESSHRWEEEGLSEMAGNQGVRREAVFHCWAEKKPRGTHFLGQIE